MILFCRLSKPNYIESTYHNSINAANSTLSRNSSSSSSNSFFDLSKYSPRNYIPNIQRSGSFVSSAPVRSSTSLIERNFLSTIDDILGGDEFSYERTNGHFQELMNKDLGNLSSPVLLPSEKSRSNVIISNRTSSLPEVPTIDESISEFMKVVTDLTIKATSMKLTIVLTVPIITALKTNPKENWFDHYTSNTSSELSVGTRK